MKEIFLILGFFIVMYSLSRLIVSADNDLKSSAATKLQNSVNKALLVKTNISRIFVLNFEKMTEPSETRLGPHD